MDKSQKQIGINQTHIVSYYSHEFYKRQNGVTQSRSVVVRDWGGVDMKTKGCVGTLGSDRNVLYQDCGNGYTTVYTCQNHQIVHSNLVNFIVCKLCLTKAN